MEKIVDLISARVSEAFEAAGYDAALGMVTVSNRHAGEGSGVPE